MDEKPILWKKETSEIVADCRIFKIREDFSTSSEGTNASFFVIQTGDWVNVIPTTSEGQVVLIEQFRHGIEEVTLEIPGGMIDDGENAETAAKRELVEETGFVANEMIFIGKSRPNPAIHDNWVYHYLATNCEKRFETEFDETESVVTKLVPSANIPELIKNGDITHSLVIAAFHWLSLRK